MTEAHAQAADCDTPAIESAFDLLGMTLRDHFASQALNGLCSNPGGPFQENGRTGWGFVNCRARDVADLSYEMADAMLKARATEATPS